MWGTTILSGSNPTERVGSPTALKRVLEDTDVKTATQDMNPNLYMRTANEEWIKVKTSFPKSPVLTHLPKHLQFVIAKKDVSPSTRRGGGRGGSPAAVDVPSTPVMLYRLRPRPRT
eukprot:GHVU01005861.1.p1 GENE.GHVU01005861.1~~GHVU01005861.1.p1  ORF type:complete len:116 (+),score=6.52 GHVU01005861.1:172-519(+)